MTVNFAESSEGTSQLVDGQEPALLCRYTSLSKATLQLLPALKRLADERLHAPCLVTSFAPKHDATWEVSAETPDGKIHHLSLSKREILNLTPFESKVKVSFELSTDLETPSYRDGFSLAATHFFKNKHISESDLLSESPLHVQQRIVLRDGKIFLKKGISKASAVFRKLYQKDKMQTRLEENRHTIEAYVAFLKKEIGAEKLQQIQQTYGFNFDEMIQQGVFLQPKHIYLCNIGMNNIEHSDVISLKKKIEMFLKITSHSNVPLVKIIKNFTHPFTQREIRGLLRVLGEDATVRDLANAFHKETTVGAYLEVLETSPESRDKLYTGRKFKAQIVGSYNREVKDRKHARPWVDQQELLQVFETMKDPFPGQEVNRQKLDRCFFEMLTKVVVKKHLMRSEVDGTWRVGAMIPSPYKDKDGKTVYYRVDQGVDSGYGKLWLVLRPAQEDYDHSLPVIRVSRDTSKDLYAQRGGPTVTRDLADNAGYRNSATTFDEDRAFFKEFSLPLWMTHLGKTMIALKDVRKTDDYASLEEPLINTHKELIGNLIARAQTGKLDPEIKDKIKDLLTPIYQEFKQETGEKRLIAAQKYLSVLLNVAPYDADDFNRLHNLINGKVPRPVASIGNSLGGFDAQQDFFAQTFRSSRIPITDVHLYTHSSLKVSLEDDNVFSNYVVNNAELLNDLGVHISIDHVAEIEDPVPLATKGTLLGQGVQMAAVDAQEKGREFPVSVSLRILKPLSKHPQLSETKIHRRRFEDLIEGVDYQVLEQYSLITDYDRYAQSHKIYGRTVEAWRQTGISLNLADVSRDVVRVWRGQKGSHRHIPKSLSFHKLVIETGEQGESSYGFIPVEHRRNLERVIYVPVDYSELNEKKEGSEDVGTSHTYTGELEHWPQLRETYSKLREWSIGVFQHPYRWLGFEPTTNPHAIRVA